MESNDGLSRKEKLAIWRAQKAGTAAAPAAAAGAGAGAGAGGKGKTKAVGGSSGSGTGVLAERASNSSSAGNGVPVNMPGKKRAGSHVAVAAPKGERGRGAQRKPFQVDARRVREASERRVAPGTPIHSLKKRLKRTSEAPNPVPTASAAAATAAAAASTGVIPTARAQAKAKAAAAARVSGHVNGVRRSLDVARTKEVSDYLKSQLSEADMLKEISGVDAARTLLADLLSCTDAARGVGELTLYWAARAKLEEDAGEYHAARRLLDEGEAYISMPTQQKVMAKVMSAFEGRMNDREEVQVARLLEDSVGSMSLDDSAANSNSPASSAPFRYDPNDLSMGDDDDDGDDPGSSQRSTVKNLNFSRIEGEGEGEGAREGDCCDCDVGSASSAGASLSRDSGSGAGTDSAASSSTRNGLGSASVFTADWMREAGVSGEGGASSGGSGSAGGGGVASMSGVIFSDDESESDLSVFSDIDEGVIARAKAFAAEEEARKARTEAAEAEVATESRAPVGSEEKDAENAPQEGEQDLCSTRDDHPSQEEREADASPDASPAASPIAPALEAAAPNVSKEGSSSSISIGGDSSSGSGSGSGSGSSSAMPPPPPQPATMAMASREPRKRKGTPHPKVHVKRTTPRHGKKAHHHQDVSPGSFIAQVEATGKDGKRTLTPVRRSRRISGASSEATPAYLRKEMEAML